MLRRLLGKEPLRPPVPLVLYTREGCHLCEEMKARLGPALRAARLSAHSLREVDIGGDPELEAEHGRSIPVLKIGGRTAFKGRLDPAALPERFERLAARWYAEQGV